MAGTVDAQEIENFEALAEAWWDPEGDFRPLHRLNPIRIGYIRNHLCAHFGRDPETPEPFEGLRLLDIGCGGGLLCEPMAELGAQVTGLDAGEKNIRIAKAHAEQSGLAIDYRHGSPETLAGSGERFDAILNMEVVEHVADRALFLRSCGNLLKEDGAMILSTLNRTVKSFAFAIIGAEYVLRWLPRGTHQWDKFVRPSELADDLRSGDMEITHMTGVSFDPLANAWRLSGDMEVNYMMLVTKEGP
ncbi:MAG: bifunctional 2-polyprenyl-6-hydroxyphenol methylase/3-demethylubiquinol 3-O-methyltransferase UbiG [Alphaproteobacteria bacterium]|nr:bifunctional 2-polyprenyl-6-hydroxyphenol methylase/3-demethylubiquinol 3-O-methyltransferase UbiG [Alphaproteobacteria bacterium]